MKKTDKKYGIFKIEGNESELSAMVEGHPIEIMAHLCTAMEKNQSIYVMLKGSVEAFEKAKDHLRSN